MAASPTSTNKMVITKTETEYNMKSIRFLLLTITTMFIVVGILMIVLGMSVYSHYHNFLFLYESARSGRFMTPSVMCVFLGFTLLVISSFGFFGSLKRSTCLVNLYALILVVILIIKLVVVILAFTMNPASIAKHIYIPVDQYVTDTEIEYEMDAMQVSLNCCGADSFLDYTNMEFTANHSTVVISEEINETVVSMLVPRTCCVGNGEIACARVRIRGCRAALVNTVIQNASVLGVLGVSVMFIELLGIIFAVLLARCIRKTKSERAMMAWKMREQLIIARQEEEKQKSLYITPQESSLA